MREGGGGPPVNSEFYPGWLDHWQSPHSKVNQACVVKTLGMTPSPSLSTSLVIINITSQAKC